MKPAQDIDTTHVFVEAFFPLRAFVFGQWCEGHNLSGRWFDLVKVSDILEFARKVKEAGGLFYFDGKRYEYFKRSYTECIEQVGYLSPSIRSELLAAASTVKPGEHRPQRSEDGAEPGEAAEDFTCLVTRKVSAKTGNLAGLGQS